MRKRSSSHTESSLSSEGRNRSSHSSHNHQGGILGSVSSSSSQHRMVNQGNTSSGHSYNRSFSNQNNSIGCHDDALRRMLKLVNSFFSRSDCIPFREPVDWRGLELWDYPQIIKKMMDLGTVKRKLERNQYQTAAECADDVRLIWSNCMTYNADGSDFFLLAESFSKRFEDRYKKIRQEFATGEKMGKAGSSALMEPPTLEAKAKFSVNLFHLTGVQLGHVLQVIDLNCPRALERPSNETNKNAKNDDPGVAKTSDEVEINVDAMDLRTFYELDSYVKEKISKSRKKNSLNNQNSSFCLSSGDHEQNSMLSGQKEKDNYSNSHHGHGSSSLGDLSPPSGNASIESDLDYVSGGGRSSSAKKSGKRKR